MLFKNKDLAWLTPLFLQLQESKAHKLAAEPGSELQADPGLSTPGY